MNMKHTHLDLKLEYFLFFISDCRIMSEWGQQIALRVKLGQLLSGSFASHLVINYSYDLFKLNQGNIEKTEKNSPFP